MPAERVAMRHAREIIRLKFFSVSTREIARRLGMARSTVRETLKRTESAGLVLAVAGGHERRTRWRLRFTPTGAANGAIGGIAEPDWPAVHRELKRKHVTLLILWDEYIAANPGGYSYSRFCELYRAFEKTLSLTMRQTHAAGERLFVDYAGDGVPVVVDRLTGEIRMAQIFVAVLGARASPSPRRAGRRRCPTGSTPTCVRSRRSAASRNCFVPDNTKTAVIKACLYDPQVNRTYAEMAAHYGAAILPARPQQAARQDEGFILHPVPLMAR